MDLKEIQMLLVLLVLGVASAHNLVSNILKTHSAVDSLVLNHAKSTLDLVTGGWLTHGTNTSTIHNVTSSVTEQPVKTAPVPPVNVQPVEVPPVNVPTVDIPPVNVPLVEVPPVNVPTVEIPPVNVPPVEVPPVNVPTVEIPPVNVPPVEVPPVNVPTVKVPPVNVPPVEVPPVNVPTVEVPPVEVPPVNVPPVKLPPVKVPPVNVPPVKLPPVKVPPVKVPPVNVPPVKLPPVKVPPLEVPVVDVPTLDVPQPMQNWYWEQPTFLTFVRSSDNVVGVDNICFTVLPLPDKSNAYQLFISVVFHDGYNAIHTFIVSQPGEGKYKFYSTQCTFEDTVFEHVVGQDSSCDVRLISRSVLIGECPGIVSFPVFGVSTVRRPPSQQCRHRISQALRSHGVAARTYTALPMNLPARCVFRHPLLGPWLYGAQ